MIANRAIRLHRITVRKQDGISLVEIMVALVISMVLLAGVGQIYIGSIQTYRLQDGQSRLQENARYALEMLSRDIRRAGTMGCQSTGSFIPTTTQRIDWARNGVPTVQPIVLANAPLVVPNNVKQMPSAVIQGPAVSGGNDTTGTFSDPSPALYSQRNDNVVRGTDAVTVLFAESCGGIITASVSTVNTAEATSDDVANLNLPASSTCATPAGPLIISDCAASHIFRIDADGTNTASSLGHTYIAGSEIMRYRAYTYYIRLNPAGEPALFRYDNNANTSDEIAEGIEDMQVRYGLDTNGDGLAEVYQAAAAGLNWAQVVVVRVDLRVRSVGYNADKLTSKPNATRVFNGANLVDSRLLKTFSISIKLRK